MNQIIEKIFITTKKVKMEESGKITCVDGNFFYNGKNYKIEDGIIKGE